MNDYKHIKEVLARDEFDGRVTNADFIMDRAYGKELGNEKYNYFQCICNYSPVWRAYVSSRLDGNIPDSKMRQIYQ